MLGPSGRTCLGFFSQRTKAGVRDVVACCCARRRRLRLLKADSWTLLSLASLESRVSCLRSSLPVAHAAVFFPGWLKKGVHQRRGAESTDWTRHGDRSAAARCLSL